MEHETGTTMFTILYKAFSCSILEQICFYVPKKTHYIHRNETRNRNHNVYNDLQGFFVFQSGTDLFFYALFRRPYCRKLKDVSLKHLYFTEMEHETGTTIFTMAYKAFSCSKVEQICCFLSRKHFQNRALTSPVNLFAAIGRIKFKKINAIFGIIRGPISILHERQLYLPDKSRSADTPHRPENRRWQ